MNMALGMISWLPNQISVRTTCMLIIKMSLSIGLTRFWGVTLGRWVSIGFLGSSLGYCRLKFHIKFFAKECEQFHVSSPQVHLEVGHRHKAFWCVRNIDDPLWWRIHELGRLHDSFNSAKLVTQSFLD